MLGFEFFFSSRRRHTRYIGDWSSDVCSSDLLTHSGGAGRTENGAGHLERPDCNRIAGPEATDGSTGRPRVQHRSDRHMCGLGWAALLRVELSLPDGHGWNRTKVMRIEHIE